MATKKNEFKCISHAERMQANKRFSDAARKEVRPLANAVERTLTTEYVRDEKTGRVSVVNKVVSRLVKERDKGLKVNDFAMDSLAAIGAVDGLKFSQFVEQSVDASLANLDRFLDAIDAADAASNNQVSDDLGY